MIGGGMLLCAVGAMILLAVWSITRDDAPDVQARDGILAFRQFTERKKYALKHEPEKAEEFAADRPQARRPRQLPRLRFDANEMAEIEEEAEAGLPQFLRDAREEY
jgi:hypothetical protein